MSIADELREWATAETLTSAGNLSDRAWSALYGMKGPGWLGYETSDDRRTFALLVAEALDHG